MTTDLLDSIIDFSQIEEPESSASFDPSAIKWTKYIPHEPHLKQHAFLWLHCQEALFGGAAGGGKSDALLMAALQWADTPEYAAIILRRTFADLSLPGAVMSRAQEWLAHTDAKWDDNKKTWKFPSGATLTFGYLQTTKDKFRYQGAEFQFIGFDEVTQFPEEDYRYLFSRLRKPEPPTGDSEDDNRRKAIVRALSGVPLRMRCATNPGGEGHRWVKTRFLDKLPDTDEPEDVQSAAERMFIPSLLEDNPSLDKGAYEASLRQLDPITQAQLRHGDWTIRQPGMWVFEADHIEAAFALGNRYDSMLRSGELGEPHGGVLGSAMDYGDFATVGLPLWPLERGGLYIPAKEALSTREDLEEIFLLMHLTMKNVGDNPLKARIRELTTGIKSVGSTQQFWWAYHLYDASFAQSNRTFVKMAEKELGMHNAIKKTGRPNSIPVSFGEYKTLCVRYIRLLLKNSYEAMKGSPTRTRILAISPRNVKLKEQMEDYEEDEFGKFLKGNDDAVDALIAGVQPLAKAHRVIIETMQEEARTKVLRGQPKDVPEHLRLVRGQRA